eukprot:PLAT8303.1.p2 GENE.PLAT8303.1~~PLAT8303.1.p2  ORF type:complete len:176 (-),score=28.91 PLAT8303.1:88-570(-)
MFRFNNVNLDVLTETYHNGFYLEYLAKWSEYFTVATAPHGQMMGYIMGKTEGKDKNWHGHVTALSVAPEYRRLGLARRMMNGLEEVSHRQHDDYFVDLFVRKSNTVAIDMYEKFGYTVYRRVIGYYSGKEDAFDMRKAMPRDNEGESVIPLDHPVYPGDL